MAVVILYVHLHIGSQISDQSERNTFLKQQISEVDKKIKEISELETEKKNLLARMNIIQELQTRRPGIVKLFDELPRRVPA
ncbi:MAG: pilus assembly protein PilN, partial [Gammaproteobacteria bacterium]|nr:pilus assembly protein PilN [Gammaproteobacteria bacterium]NIR93556.1 pilus assembly protein PilN [Gammaproteobacteria bacterium]NIW47021.1 pilus assembly protein PilN [Gammaproteobacteria bacterium]